MRGGHRHARDARARLAGLATDAEEEAIQRTRGRVPPELQPRLQTRVTPMEDVELPAVDLLWASFSLFFCDPARFADVWARIFPLVLPPQTEDGLGIMLLNSNAETHFSFTNALGLISSEQVKGIDIAMAQYPRARWLIALHHHPVEYPRATKALSERIGTALINGSWFVRRLRRSAGRVALMHGHRHVDWIGECGGLLIISAPSPVMSATDDLPSYFYIQTFTDGPHGRLRILAPERVTIEGQPQGA